MHRADKLVLTMKVTDASWMTIPTHNWLSVPHNGGVNGNEIDDFFAWLHTLNTKFEWVEDGLKFLDRDNGRVRHARCGDILCQCRDENGTEIVVSFEERTFRYLFSVDGD